MAGPELINAYLAELRRALRRAEEAEEILAEVDDHLREVTDVHIAQGMSPGSAERHALGQFGTTELVARAFRRRGEGIAMPTRFTRTGGCSGCSPRC